MNFLLFGALSFVFFAIFPLSLVLSLLVLGLEQTKQLLFALLEEFLQTLLIMLCALATLFWDFGPPGSQALGPRCAISHQTLQNLVISCNLDQKQAKWHPWVPNDTSGPWGAGVPFVFSMHLASFSLAPDA